MLPTPWLVTIAAIGAAGGAEPEMCTRILYQSGANDVIGGRSMDWAEDTRTNLWSFPRGMARDGAAGPGSIRWVANHGSVIATIYDVATVDGMNDAGLVGNALYLAESDYGAAPREGQDLISVGAILQYALDMFGTVADAAEWYAQDSVHIVAPPLPGGKAASGHLALSDPSGDSAVIEYLDGRPVVHHGAQYTVMTNSPTYDQQLAITDYWKTVGGMAFLPGTNRAADRFARASFNLNATPHFGDARTALAAVLSQVRSVSVPLGIADPERPNIASTIWRSVTDHSRRRYYYDSALNPSVFWVDVDKLNLAEGAPVGRLWLEDHPILAGEVSAQFAPAEPFAFLG